MSDRTSGCATPQPLPETYWRILSKDEQYRLYAEACVSAERGGQDWSHFDAAYSRACESSQPQDWMKAALLAQQVRYRVSPQTLNAAPGSGGVSPGATERKETASGPDAASSNEPESKGVAAILKKWRAAHPHEMIFTRNAAEDLADAIKAAASTSVSAITTGKNDG